METEAMIKKMLTRKIFWIAPLVLVVLGLSGYFIYAKFFKTTTEASSEPTLQTAVARRGELEILASGTGQVVAAYEISLGFDEEGGTVIALNVEIGDEVKKGDLLARVQTQNSEEDIQAAIADAELTVVKAQIALDELYKTAETSKTSALNDIATYAQDVRDAQYQVENYTVPLYLQGLGVVEGVDLMKKKLDAASKAFDPYRYLPENDETREDYLELLNDAQSEYDAAVKRLNYDYALQVAQANLAKARQEYEAYKDGPATDELSQAEAELANAKAKLALAKESKSIKELYATIDGTVMAVDTTLGGVVSRTPIITLADLTRPQLEAYLDETDLDKVAIGYQVDVTFDALPDNVYTGEVVRVDPGLVTVSNVQAIKILVLLGENQIDKDKTLPVGLNASADVIAGRVENAVLVPVEALRDLGDGEYGVFVVNNGELEFRSVEVGLMDVTTVEIVSGLEAGEVVSTGIVQTQ